jgi:glycine cleavage system transcriptional repressor
VSGQTAKDFVIAVMSRDRVGIVADVTRALNELKGSVDALSQTVMRGYFTLIITVSFRKSISGDAVRTAVEKSGAPGELDVSIKVREPEAAKRVPVDGDQFVLSITGKDRPGVISRLSAYLSSRGINIADLYSYAQGKDFVLISQLVIPRHMDVRQIQIDLEGLSGGPDLAIHLQHQDIFVATNEIEFRHKGQRATEPERQSSREQSGRGRI